MASSSPEPASSASGSSGKVPPPRDSWATSTLQEADIEDLVERDLLPEKEIFGLKCCYGEDFPSEDRTKTVVFRSFYEKGFGLPAGAFSAVFFTSTGSR